MGGKEVIVRNQGRNKLFHFSTIRMQSIECAGAHVQWMWVWGNQKPAPCTWKVSELGLMIFSFSLCKMCNSIGDECILLHHNNKSRLTAISVKFLVLFGNVLRLNRAKTVNSVIDIVIEYQTKILRTIRYLHLFSRSAAIALPIQSTCAFSFRHFSLMRRSPQLPLLLQREKCRTKTPEEEEKKRTQYIDWISHRSAPFDADIRLPRSQIQYAIKWNERKKRIQ